MRKVLIVVMVMALVLGVTLMTAAEEVEEPQTPAKKFHLSIGLETKSLDGYSLTGYTGSLCFGREILRGYLGSWIKKREDKIENPFFVLKYVEMEGLTLAEGIYNPIAVRPVPPVRSFIQDLEFKEKTLIWLQDATIDILGSIKEAELRLGLGGGLLIGYEKSMGAITIPIFRFLPPLLEWGSGGWNWTLLGSVGSELGTPFKVFGLKMNFLLRHNFYLEPWPLWAPQVYASGSIGLELVF